MITPRVSPTPAFRTMKDGREICNSTAAGKREYDRRKQQMWERDKGLCCLCFQPIAFRNATWEHFDGRGMGGGRRDDRIEFGGVSHFWGNYTKGSTRLLVYLRIPLEQRIRICRGQQ
jgi:hypothetical protein